MKKLLLSILAVAGISTLASAEAYTYVMADQWGSATVALTAWTTADGFTITPDKAEGNNNPSYNQAGDARLYAKNTLTISSSSQTITGVKFAISEQGLKRFTEVTPSVGTIANQGKNPLVWEGSTTEVTYTVGEKAIYGSEGETKAGQFDFTAITIYTNGTPVEVDPVDPPVEPVVIYAESFLGSQGDWTINNVTIPEELTYVWSSTTSYGMKASGYANSTNYDTEAWLISPEIDLNGCTEISLEFEHALNFFADVETAKAEATVWARVANGEWAQLTDVAYPETLSWTFIPSGKVNLEAYAGKKLQLAFKYVSTATKAGTWEVKNLQIKAVGGSGPVQPELLVVSSIKEFLDKAETKMDTKIDAPVTVFYQNGRYLYITDNTANLLVYGDLTNKYTNGQVIAAGITGRYTNYSNGQLQMANPVDATFVAGTQGNAVNPTTVTCEEIAADMVNTYVKLDNVTISDNEANNTWDMTDATNTTVVLYNQFNNANYYDVVDVTTGSNLTVVGVVGIHSGNVQVLPFIVTSDSGVASAAVDNTEAVYYNLQGMRINGELTPGLYIKRQGNNATKVLVR